MPARDDVDFVYDQVREHHAWFDRSIPMIASENLISPLARRLLVSDFHDRYAEGRPGKRYYQGLPFVDEVERRATALAQRLFDAGYADVRPVSGTNANQAAFFATAKPGDTITAVGTAAGGHISHARFGAAGVRGLTIETYPFDEARMNLDPDGAAKLIREVEPRVCLFGQSVFLFPTPLREGIADAAKEVGATVMYDGAHVLGLIGGNRFQDPLREGADFLTASTHKTLPGPQGGVILGNMPQADMEEKGTLARKLDRGVFPGVVSNHHLHHMAAKAVAFAEHIEFGEAYADQVVRNAQALGQALHERGIPTLAEDLGFTASHQVVVDVSDFGGGKQAAQDLEDASIITNMNMLPGDTKPMDPSGLRLGSQEMTRLGMEEGAMDEVAGFIHAVVVKGRDPADVAEDVAAFRSDYADIHYCFGEPREAYRFWDLA